MSPFYSPCLANSCPDALLLYPVFQTWTLSPALLILGVPLGFRLTCYYYRKAYYRSFFTDPPGCAVQEGRRRYWGELKFPFVLQNLHRYFMWLALVVLVFLWYDALIAFGFTNVISGKLYFDVSLVGVVLLVNAVLLTFFTLGCNSLRHIVGGGSDCFTCTVAGRAKKRGWRIVTRFNEHHMLWAWLSLISVGLADLVVRLTASGVLADVRLL